MALFKWKIFLIKHSSRRKERKREKKYIKIDKSSQWTILYFFSSFSPKKKKKNPLPFIIFPSYTPHPVCGTPRTSIIFLLFAKRESSRSFFFLTHPQFSVQRPTSRNKCLYSVMFDVIDRFSCEMKTERNFLFLPHEKISPQSELSWASWKLCCCVG